MHERNRQLFQRECFYFSFHPCAIISSICQRHWILTDYMYVHAFVVPLILPINWEKCSTFVMKLSFYLCPSPCTNVNSREIVLPSSLFCIGKLKCFTKAVYFPSDNFLHLCVMDVLITWNFMLHCTLCSAVMHNVTEANALQSHKFKLNVCHFFTWNQVHLFFNIWITSYIKRNL